LIGTSLISKTEVAAALTKAMRQGVLSGDEAQSAWKAFRSEWPSFVRIGVSEHTVERAAVATWQYVLPGYGAVHLATALFWQDAVGESVVLATLDRQLWRAGESAGLVAWPVSYVAGP